MADFDPSIPAKVGQPTGLAAMNPLQMLATMGQINAQANQNALFQQEFAAKRAMGPIFQQAVDAEGNLDMAKVAKGLAASPEAAFKAPDVLQALQQKALLEVQKHEIDIRNARTLVGNLANGLTGALGNPNFTNKDLNAVVVGTLADIPGKAERERFTATAASMLAQLPPQPGADATPQAWDQWRGAVRESAKPLLARMDAQQGAMDLVLGKLQQQDVGSGILTTRTSQLQGTVQDAKGQAAFLPKDLTPGERAAPVTVPRPGGTQEVMPTTKFLQGAGAAAAGVGASQGQPQGQTGFVSTSPALVRGQEDAVVKLNDYAGNLAERAAAYQSSIDNLRLSWEAVKPGWTGPGTDAFAGFAKVLTTLGAPEEAVRKIVDLDKYQVLEKATVRRAMDELMAGVQGSGSRIAQQEYMNFKDTAAGVNTTKEAMRVLFDFTQSMADKTMLKQKLLSAYMDKNQNNPQRSVTNFEQTVWTPALERLGKLKYREQPNATR